MSSGKARPNSKGRLFKNNHVVESEKTSLIPKDAQVQNVKSGKVYVFGDADIASDDDNQVEMAELRPRGKARKQHKEFEMIEEAEPVYLERPVVDGDTLQGVAIKYGIQVSELKRINNLMKDQDFFGLQIIKVPMKRHGLMSELVEKEHELINGAKLLGESSGDTVHYEANETENDSEHEGLLVRTLSIRDSFVSNQGKEAASFLQRMDKDLKSIIQSTKIEKDSLEDAISTMTCKRIYPLQRQSTWLNGYDCGMRWWSVLLTFIVIGFIAPLIYFIYLEVQKKTGS